MLTEKEVNSVVCNQLGKKRLYFDGAMGTMLQNRGLKLGEIPEIYNITHSELIESIHREYLQAGSHFVTTNTFGANRYKMQKSEYTVEEIITKAIDIAKAAKVDFPDTYIALDVGPSGKVLKPIGDISFEESYEVFKEQVIIGEKAGADVILLETFYINSRCVSFSLSPQIEPSSDSWEPRQDDFYLIRLRDKITTLQLLINFLVVTIYKLEPELA